MQRTIQNSLFLSALLVALASCSNDAPKPAADARPATTAKTEPKVESKSEPKKDAAPVKTTVPDATPAQPASPATAVTPPGTTTPATPPASTPATTKDATSATPPAVAPSGDPAVAAMREFIALKKIDKSAKNWKSTVPMPPKLTFDPARKYFWSLTTTEGPIKIRLMPDVAPMHVSSLIYLTELGFYDDTLFHRVIPGFMAQGGDPLGNGMGGPGYKYASEFSPTVKHTKPGLLSMANTGMPSTDGSQFFLTFVATPHLDNKHTVFGEVVEGLDNLMKLEKFGSPAGATSKVLKLESAKIVNE